MPVPQQRRHQPRACSPRSRTQQSARPASRILFLVEANPGPGLGHPASRSSFFGIGLARASAPGAIIIQFFGGIHEIYSPVRAHEADPDPRRDRGWRMTGVATNVLFNSGLGRLACAGQHHRGAGAERIATVTSG
jgi:PTS system mannitol-specific IIC component